jgi:hypothetical protein
MAGQPPDVIRSSDTKPDDQPTLILQQLKCGESNEPAEIMDAQEGKPPGKVLRAEDSAIAGSDPTITSFGRVKKFCTSSPSRKAASAASAIMIAALSGIAGTIAPGFLHSRSSTATQRILYAPWIDGDELSPNLHVARTIKGNCWIQSDETPRRDAYRCLGGDSQIYDPCFSNDSQKAIVCPMPSPEDVTSLRLEKPLPKPGVNPPEDQLPSGSAVWLIDLTDGDDCYRISAASYSAGGMLLTYECKDGNLYGEVNRDSNKWTIWEQKKGSADLTLASIAEAYT